MATTKTTAKNICSGKTVDIPAPGKIVKISYNTQDRRGDWNKKASEVTGIVMSHGSLYDWNAETELPTLNILALNGKTYEMHHNRVVKSTATRSVPAAAREVLTSIYKWNAVEKEKWDAKIRKLEEQKAAACHAAGADNVEKSLAEALGILTETEFESRIRELLEKNLPGFKRDGWGLDCWGRRITIWYDKHIEKYYSGPLSYLEYDDCRVLESNAEETEEGQRYIRRYHKSLPVKAPLKEYLSLGDKNWLCYQAHYEIAELDKHEMLTEGLAKEIVENFCQ